jgi:hypothetical protein
VETSTAVPLPSGSRTAVTEADAVPLPRLSFPLASNLAVCVASSRCRNVPVPEYCSDTGPSLTFTVPAKSSPSTDVSAAPGKHGATASRSLKIAQVSATDAGTVNRWVSSIEGSRRRCASSRSGRREDSSAGEDSRQVPAVVGVAVGVARG